MAWVVTARSDELPPGTVARAEVGDRVLVLWRGASGEACAMDARCPHQWSDLATDGVVDGDELVCTTHCWRFDRQGRGSKLNVLGRRDPKGDIEVLECRERDGALEVRLGPSAR